MIGCRQWKGESVQGEIHEHDEAQPDRTQSETSQDEEIRAEVACEAQSQIWITDPLYFDSI